MATVSFASAERLVEPQSRSLAARVFGSAKRFVEEYRAKKERVDWMELLFNLDDKNPVKRIAALEKVQQYDLKEFMYKVEELCDDPNPVVRQIASKVCVRLETCAQC